VRGTVSGAIALLLLSASAACGSLDDGGLAASSATAHVEVFKPSGLKQCGEEAPAPRAGARLLESNGTKVFASGCAARGGLRAQMCGLDRGLVYVYEIDRAALPKAQSLGFSATADAAGGQYRKIPCS
jgi:hypothetical protein